VIQCNVGKRGWMSGIGGCPNVGGVCIGCTMPGFPDRFMPFLSQPPGSLLSAHAITNYGRAIRALRRFTQASFNKEPSWRRKSSELTTGYISPASGDR
jgi:hydrogenase small subunit